MEQEGSGDDDIEDDWADRIRILYLVEGRNRHLLRHRRLRFRLLLKVGLDLRFQLLQNRQRRRRRL